MFKTHRPPPNKTIGSQAWEICKLGKKERNWKKENGGGGNIEKDGEGRGGKERDRQTDRLAERYMVIALEWPLRFNSLATYLSLHHSAPVNDISDLQGRGGAIHFLCIIPLLTNIWNQTERWSKLNGRRAERSRNCTNLLFRMFFFLPVGSFHLISGMTKMLLQFIKIVREEKASFFKCQKK